MATISALKCVGPDLKSCFAAGVLVPSPPAFASSSSRTYTVGTTVTAAMVGRVSTPSYDGKRWTRVATPGLHVFGNDPDAEWDAAKKHVREALRECAYHVPGGDNDR